MAIKKEDDTDTEEGLNDDKPSSASAVQVATGLFAAIILVATV